MCLRRVKSSSPYEHSMLLVSQTASQLPASFVRAQGNQERLQGLIHHAEGCSKPAQSTLTSSPFHSYKETVSLALFAQALAQDTPLDVTEFGKAVWHHGCAQGPSSTYRRREEKSAVLSETLRENFTRDRAQQNQTKFHFHSGGGKWVHKWHQVRSPKPTWSVCAAAYGKDR